MVVYVRNTNLYLVSWTPPFLLTVPGMDNSISYCIQIKSESSMVISSLCKIHSAEYIFKEFDYITKYKAIVTAVNLIGQSPPSIVLFPGKLIIIIVLLTT